MSYKMFIDDERSPTQPEWIVVRSSEAAKQCVKERGIPQEIAFDHDLGGDDTSMNFLKWLADFMLDYRLKFPELFSYTIHSQNPVGAANIQALLDAMFIEFNCNLMWRPLFKTRRK